MAGPRRRPDGGGPRLARAAAWLALLVSLALTAAAWRLADGREREAARADLEMRAMQLAAALGTRMHAYEQLLRGAAGLWATAGPIGRQEWRTFVEALALETLPGIEGMGWAERVPASRRAAHEEAVRAQGLPDYRVFPVNDTAGFHAPVTWLEPSGGRNLRALGFDMYGEPVRRRAMQQSMDSGQPGLSAPVVLVQEDERPRQPGFLAYLAVYRPGAPVATVEQRRAATLGWVYAPFRAADFVHGALGPGWDDLRFEVRDVRDGARLFAAGEYRAEDATDEPALRVDVRMIDREWSLSVWPGATWRAGAPSTADAVAAGGLLASLLLFGVVWALGNTRVRAEAMADRMTVALRQANETLEARVAERTESLREGHDRLAAFNDKLRAVNAAFGAIGEPGPIDQRLATIAARLREIVPADAVVAVAHRMQAGGPPAVGIDAIDALPDDERDRLRSEALASDRSGHPPARADEPRRWRLQAPLLDAHGRTRGYLLLVREGAPFAAEDTAVLSQFALLVGTSLSLNETLGRERHARALAERADRAKDEMLAVVSHELRTPLNAIQGWLHVLRRRRADDALLLGRALEVIQRNLDTQVQLVDDLLDTARIVTGKLRLELRPIDLVPLLRTAVETVRPLAEAKQLELRLAVSDDTFQTVGDAQRLEQVVWNLLSNAVKFTPAHGTIGVRLERFGWLAQLEVEDTGQGIEPAFLPYVFDRFRQADSSSTRAAGGLGLGLALVQHIVQAHGGQVIVRSDGPGRGSVFTVSLPLGMEGAADWSPAEAALDDDPAQAVEEAPAHEPPDAPQPLLGLVVMVVEDHDDSRALLVEFLQGQGARVHAAASAPEAMRQLQALAPEARPAVLLCDIALPGESGYELLARIRAFERQSAADAPPITAFAVSAFAREDDRRRSTQAGFAEHLTKPLSQPDLVARLVRAISARDTGGATSRP